MVAVFVVVNAAFNALITNSRPQTCYEHWCGVSGR